MLPYSPVEFSVCIEEVIITQSEVVVITLETIKDRITEILIGIIALVIIEEILKIINREIRKYNSNPDQIILEVVVTTEVQTTDVLTTRVTRII